MDILVADDEDDIRIQVCQILEDEGYSPRPAATIASAMAEIQQRLPALAVVDVWFRHCEKDGISILEELLRRNSDIPVVMISGHSTVDMAVRAIKKGAYDFLTKPFALESLLNSVERALQQGKLSREHREMSQQLGQSSDQRQEWHSPLMLGVMKQIDQWASTDRRLLILGERGCGKTRLALNIHQQSKRSQAALLRHNCAEYENDEEHYEVLFGNETGTAGKIELAHQGTLVLENIESLNTALQTSLTKFMQSQYFYRQSGQQRVTANVRILSISSLSVEELEADTGIMASFMSVIGLGVINVPALRHRKEDLPELVRQIHTRLEFSFGHKTVDEKEILAADALEALSAHTWPQNIHELENVITRLYWFAGDIGKAEVKRAIGDEINHQHKDKAQQWRRMIASIDLPLREARELFERHYLHYHLERFNASVSHTAQYVGMDRAALHRKIRSLNIDDLDHQGSEPNGETQPVSDEGFIASEQAEKEDRKEV